MGKRLNKGVIGILIFALSIMIMPSIYASEVETGIIGEYDTLEEAEVVAAENEKDDETETVVTEITQETREIIEDYIEYDELFSTRIGATFGVELFRTAYSLMGYDVSEAEITTQVITETEVETRVFHSIAEIQAYRALQEAAGYNVEIHLVDLGVTTREVNKESVDETFDSILGLLRYLLSLARDHNNFDLHYEDASYTVTIEEDITETFSSRLEVLAYIARLRLEYDDIVANITYRPAGTKEVETVNELFTSEDDAEAYCEDLENQGYTLENKEITELTSEEININNVLESENIDLSNEDVTFNAITALGNTNVTIDFINDAGETIHANGTINMTEIIIDGNSHRPILNSLIITVPNNTPVTIKGTVTTNYCIRYRTTIFGRICLEYQKLDFVTDGIINADYNGETTIFTRNSFIYVPESLDYTDQTLKISDNLVHIYELNVDKISVTEEDSYLLEAHVHSEEVVPQIRVYGEVSRIEIIPEYTIEATKTRDVTKYEATANATLMGEKDVYVVSYTKTTKDPVIPEEPTPVDPVKPEPINPKTADSIDSFVAIFAMSVLGFGTSFTFKNKKQY